MRTAGTRNKARLRALKTAVQAAVLSYKMAAQGKSLDSIMGREDDLTGLPNRKAFYEHAEKAGACPVAVIDCDNFKTINDTLGHERGDMVLRVLGAILRQSETYSARLGGDEFVLVIEQPAGLEQIVDRIRARARELAGVSLSIGVSPCGGSLRQRLSDADQAMYRDKQSRSQSREQSLQTVQLTLYSAPGSGDAPAAPASMPALNLCLSA